MGRIGDGDVHAAYVEFRAKDSDKVAPLFPSAAPSLLSFTLLLAHLSNTQNTFIVTQDCVSYHPLFSNALICGCFSASLHNASTANLCGRKILPASANTSSNAQITSLP